MKTTTVQKTLRVRGLAVLVGVALVAAASAQPEPLRYGAEVAEGRVLALEEIQLELQRNIAVGGAEDEQIAAWRYDWAYLNWRIAQNLGEAANARRKDLLKEAEDQLDLLLAYDPENPETQALRGSVIGDRIEGSFSGAFLGRRASASHKRAVELGPENPRAALLRGVGLYYAPKAFGGGRVAAEAELRRAVDLFDDRDEDDDWPNWGRVDSLAWLGILLTEQGNTEEARRLFDRALEIQPTSVWIRDELVSSAEKASEPPG